MQGRIWYGKKKRKGRKQEGSLKHWTVQRDMLAGRKTRESGGRREKRFSKKRGKDEVGQPSIRKGARPEAGKKKKKKKNTRTYRILEPGEGIDFSVERRRQAHNNGKGA